MEPFTYESCIGTVTVTFMKLIRDDRFSVEINGTFFIRLGKNEDGIWQVWNPVPPNFFTGDIQAIVDEIEKRL